MKRKGNDGKEEKIAYSQVVLHNDVNRLFAE